MSHELKGKIERWFTNDDDDGEFVRHSRMVPYSLLGPRTGVQWTIFTTKPAVILRALEKVALAGDFAMVGRYGLPNDLDLTWIRDLVGGGHILFLGDMDPVDVMVYAWLRIGLAPKHVRHFGLSDRFLGDIRGESRESLILPCSRSEQSAIRELGQILPDLHEIVGIACLGLLEAGRKIELEAVVNTRCQQLGSAFAALHDEY